MRYDVKKYLFVGPSKERDRFFQKAQEFGIVHFIQTGPARTKEVPADVQDNMTAIKILRGLPPTEQEEVDEQALADGLIHKILDLKQSLEKLAEEQRVTRLEIARIEAFGDFSLKDIADIERDTGRKVQFYFAKEGYATKLPVPDDAVQVATEHGLDYFVAFNKELTHFPKMVEMHIQRPLGELRKRTKEISAAIHHTEHRLKGYAKYNTFLHHSLIHKLNSYNLQDALNDAEFELDGSLFAVTGWVPVNKLDALQPLVESLDVHVEEIAQDPKDVPPTFLDNQGAARVGEDLINIYDTPSNSDKDPSLWVLFFFALFFSFIMGDGGYGLIFLIVALYVNYKYRVGATGKRVLKLVTILGTACIVWGFLTTSFFGITFDIDSPIRKVSLVQWLSEKKVAYMMKDKDQEWRDWVKKFPQVETATDAKDFLRKGSTVSEGKTSYEVLNRTQDAIMFELALLIGVIHIIISLLRYSDRNLTAYGWVAFLIGAYLYFPTFLNVASVANYVFGIDKEAAARNGMYLMFGGIGFATVVALFKHKWLGIFEPMTLIQIFADTMSYLRLYALGLSGSMLVATMYDLASGMNFVLAALIILAGHVTNFVLCIMSGTIHGLRLNFLEWYHYSFEGGGKMFNPLRKIKIE